MSYEAISGGGGQIPSYCPHKGCQWSVIGSEKRKSEATEIHLRVVHKNAPLPEQAKRAAPPAAVAAEPSAPMPVLEAMIKERALPAPPHGRPVKWTREAILSTVQARAAELGRPPSSSHMPAAVVSASVREFGSWSSAVQCAGFPRPTSGRAPVRAVVPLAEVAKPEVALSEPGVAEPLAGTSRRDTDEGQGELASRSLHVPGSLSRHDTVAGFLAATVTRAELERMLHAARARGDRFRTEAARAEGEAVTIMYALALGEAA